MNADVIRAIVRAAIDTGAACQKAGSFVAVEPGKPARSVYDVVSEQALETFKSDISQWADKPDGWSDQIAAAHPLRTGDNDTYAVAMDMVGNRRSKGALVELVNWLLKGRPG